jgi:hypothetical protein
MTAIQNNGEEGLEVVNECNALGVLLGPPGDGEAPVGGLAAPGVVPGLGLAAVSVAATCRNAEAELADPSCVVWLAVTE